MEFPKNGESSRTPTGATARLILPQWDPLPEKHLHASLDMISLMHLDGLYNTYVRPYFDPVPETDDEGMAGGGAKRPRKKQGLSKGYVGLLEDCIDPMPMGAQGEHSLLPLVGEWLEPQRPPWAPDESAQGPLAILSSEVFQAARLEPGHKVPGYSGGEKDGVKVAEEKRRRKKARMSQSVAPDLPDLAGSPAPGVPNPPPPKARTPFNLPRKPGHGQKPFPRASAPPGMGGGAAYRPGTPGTPTPRPYGAAAGTPSSASLGTRTPGTPSLKRPGPEAGPANAKRRNVGMGSRSASPAAGASGAPPEVSVKGMFKR